MNKIKSSIIFILLLIQQNLSAQTTTYLWSNGATTSTINVIPSVTTTYRVTISQNGVDYYDSLIVAVNGNPTISGASSVCSNKNTQLTGTGIPAVSNAWVSSNASVATVSSTGLVTGVAAGTVTITYTNSDGCSTTQLITVYPSLVGIDYITSCSPITWIDGNSYTASNNSATFTIVSGSAYGCDSTVTLNLTILPTATSTTNTTICASQLPYSWNGLTFNAAGSQTATLSGTNGCDSLATLNLTVNPNTTPTFTQVGPYLSGTSIPSLPTTSINGITGTWSPSINNSNTTTYTFTPSAGQCAIATTMTITINEPLQFSLMANDSSVCSGTSVTLSVSIDPSYPVGTVKCQVTLTKVKDVLNPTTGKTWMDRNLGASRAAISSTDSQSYGDLYQWGRRSDGHQCRNSSTTNILSSVDQPAHSDFIISLTNWQNTPNYNLWQGVNGVNNPCPEGYRVPTSTELTNERLSWSSNNPAGAFASPLKLPMAGYRDHNNGDMLVVGNSGYYTSSTASSSFNSYLRFTSGAADISPARLASGLSVRCIKN